MKDNLIYKGLNYKDSLAGGIENNMKRIPVNVEFYQSVISLMRGFDLSYFFTA